MEGGACFFILYPVPNGFAIDSVEKTTEKVDLEIKNGGRIQMKKGENIFLRKDGRYEARYKKGRDESGKLIYGFCYGKTYEEAKRKAKDAERLAIIAKEAAYRREIVFADYCNKWLVANSTRLKASSCAKYKSDIENHIKPFFGDRFPHEITSEKVDDFTRILLHEKKLSAKTTRDILAIFHSIFTYVKKRTEQRLQEPEIIYPQKYRKVTRVLSKREEEELIHFLADEMDLCKFGVYLALRTGLRIGEVCALRWRDISMNAYTITISHTVQRIRYMKGKDGAKTGVVVGAPKSDSSCRTIPLMPDVAALCIRFCQSDPETFVLTGTGRCMEPRKLQRRLKAYMEACGIEKVHFHTLRHTFATRCVEVGFDVKTLSEILGHSNISITLNQYVHPNLDLKRENMSRLKTMITL